MLVIRLKLLSLITLKNNILTTAMKKTTAMKMNTAMKMSMGLTTNPITEWNLLMQNGMK